VDVGSGPLVPVLDPPSTSPDDSASEETPLYRRLRLLKVVLAIVASLLTILELLGSL